MNGSDTFYFTDDIWTQGTYAYIEQNDHPRKTQILLYNIELLEIAYIFDPR